MQKKYFFFDIDGTLAIGNTGVIPESTKKTISKLKENGHFVAIATGRLQANAINHCKEIGINNMVSDGGNGVTINGELIYHKPLNHNKCIELLEELESKEIGWSITCNNTCVRYANTDKFSNCVIDTYITTVINPNLDFRRIKEFYKIYVSCSIDVQKEIKTLESMPVVRFNPNCLFIEPDDKSIGIKTIMDYFNAPYEDVVVFGDGTNDLKMFRDEWTCIAMGNGRDSLKEKATFVTKDCDEDGIEYACKHFKWI